MNISAYVLLIILWALHEYFIYLRAPAGVWIMQLVSLRGKRTVAESPKLTDVLMQPQTTHQSSVAEQLFAFLIFFNLSSQANERDQNSQHSTW